MPSALYSPLHARNLFLANLKWYLWITCGCLSLIMDEGRG
jgi:hypothetical protein